MIFLQADAIGNTIFRDEKSKKIQPWDVYPTLFEEEKKLYETYSQQEELETFKERRRAAMDRYNAESNLVNSQEVF